MKIGYPCKNLSLDFKGNRTFRLKSYSEERLIQTVQNNLDCTLEILRFNVNHDILFFRITSDLIPFASHPVCQFKWQAFFQEKFTQIGDFIRAHGIRISMHPDQFTLINSPDTGVYERSIEELAYHAQVLDLMGIGTSAKIQIHVGGGYGDKEKSIVRFLERFLRIDEGIKRRLVVENDDRIYTVEDCNRIHAETGIPVLFDAFHHATNNSGIRIRDALDLVTPTWKEEDGLPMIDYSSQRSGERKGRHAQSIDPRAFRKFLEDTKPSDFDLMLEIKDKERSALKAIEIASGDPRLCKPTRRAN